MSLGALHARPCLTLLAVVFDALTARIAEDAGFEALLLGGYALAARTMVPDPVLSLEDVAAATRYIAPSVSVPLAVDAAAGWGGASQVAHATSVLERSGAGAILLEDQFYPRTMFVEEVVRLISTEEMVDKVKAAVSSRRSPRLAVIARCGAMLTHGYEEAIGRAHRYAAAGADLVQLYPPPRTPEETKRAPRDLAGVALSYINSEANPYGRDVYTASQLEEWGWKSLLFGPGALVAAANAARDVYVAARATGLSGIQPERMKEMRRNLDDTWARHAVYRRKDSDKAI